MTIRIEFAKLRFFRRLDLLEARVERLQRENVTMMMKLRRLKAEMEAGRAKAVPPADEPSAIVKDENRRVQEMLNEYIMFPDEIDRMKGGSDNG